MGYAASGDGSVTLKAGTTIEDVKNLLKDIDVNSDLDYEINCAMDGNPILDVWESDTHWHEEDTFEFLNALVPVTVSGELFYHGEDGENWKYVYNEKEEEWEDKPGNIVYDESVLTDFEDEALINELKNRGYKVTKPRAKKTAKVS